MSDRVDQHGRVLAATRDREVVDTQHCHRPHLGIGQRVHQSQQRSPACRNPELGGQARPCPAGQRQPDVLQHSAAQRSPAGMLGGQVADLLSERPNRTVLVAAEEPAHP